MTSTVALVELRSSDGGGPIQAARKLGSHSLLELAVRGASDCQQLDRVIVVAGDSPDDARLAEAVPPDISVHLSSRRDTLGRFASAGIACGAAAVVCISPNQPFVNPVLIDRLVTTASSHPDCDYIGYCRSDGQPAIRSAIGMFAQWCRVSALTRADREARTPADRNQPVRFIYSHPELFHLRFVSLPVEFERHGEQLALDDDYWERAEALYDAYGCEGLDPRRIAGFLRPDGAQRPGGPALASAATPSS